MSNFELNQLANMYNFVIKMASVDNLGPSSVRRVSIYAINNFGIGI